MESNTGKAPEHDEKTGSFAPRTSGAPTPQKKSFRLTKLHLAGALCGGIVLFAILYPTVILPWQETKRLKLHPPRALFAMIDELNSQEEIQGQGAALEPDIDKRDALARAMSEMQQRFPAVRAVVTPCVLDLHDMHLIDPSGRVLRHIMLDEDLEQGLRTARDTLPKIDPELRPTVLIENEGIRVYDRLGNQLEL